MLCNNEPLSNSFLISTSEQNDDFTQSAPINTKSQKLIGILVGFISVLLLVVEVIVITVKRKYFLHAEDIEYFSSSPEENELQIIKSYSSEINYNNERNVIHYDNEQNSDGLELFLYIH